MRINERHFTVPEGPVFAPSSNETDENVLFSDTQAMLQIIDNTLIVFPLLLQRPTSVNCTKITSLLRLIPKKVGW
jgi:hypothetical protein